MTQRISLDEANPRWRYDNPDTEEESVDKERVYVSSREEAPDDVEVHEGDQGGLYYETGSTEPGESEDDSEGFGGAVDLDDAQQQFAERQPEVVGMIHQLQGKFGPKLTQSFMQNASKVVDYIDAETVNQATALFLNADGEPSVGVNLSKAMEGKRMAEEVIEAHSELMKDNEEVLEIKDYYRVWVKSPDSVPDGKNVLYDKEGDPAGNHYYYEVPFQTKTRIDVSEDVDKELTKAMQSKAQKDYPERVDLVDVGVPEKDLTLVDKARTQIENGMPLFGRDIRKSNPSILNDVESGLTLLHLYKTLYDEGAQYEAFMNQIQKELGRRGIYSFEKVSKARRYINSPDA